jgi:hypothetical protein
VSGGTTDLEGFMLDFRNELAVFGNSPSVENGDARLAIGRVVKAIDKALDNLVASTQAAAVSAPPMPPELAALGDRLAHELLYSEHPALLDAWWTARGGHDKCTVCK